MQRDIDRSRLIMHMKPLDLTLEEMGDLLAARDRLAEGTTAADRWEAAERLALYVALAEERCDRLRERLAAGEALSETLRTEVEAAARARPSR